MKTLAEAYPEEQARLRRCLELGREIGPAGAFYCMIAENLLRRADAAVMAQDLPAMIAVYEEMKGFKE